MLLKFEIIWARIRQVISKRKDINIFNKKKERKEKKHVCLYGSMYVFEYKNAFEHTRTHTHM